MKVYIAQSSDIKIGGSKHILGVYTEETKAEQKTQEWLDSSAGTAWDNRPMPSHRKLGFEAWVSPQEVAE